MRLVGCTGNNLVFVQLKLSHPRVYPEELYYVSGNDYSPVAVYIIHNAQHDGGSAS
jgi:hypothetical protein